MRLALLLAALIVVPTLQPVLAQDAADRTRVLRAWSEPVKLSDGTTDTYANEIVFDYATGEARQVVRDSAGRLVTSFPVRQPRPTPAEMTEARTLLMAETEFQALRSARPFDADGGFILLEDAGMPCGPGSRCLQLDLLDTADRTQRVGYVVVDLVTRTVVYPDFDPARQGNRR
ncbi:MAG: hypothetical protein AAF809_07200 [Bacteroidota bacterium]